MTNRGLFMVSEYSESCNVGTTKFGSYNNKSNRINKRIPEVAKDISKRMRLRGWCDDETLYINIKEFANLNLVNGMTIEKLKQEVIDRVKEELPENWVDNMVVYDNPDVETFIAGIMAEIVNNHLKDNNYRCRFSKDYDENEWQPYEDIHGIIYEQL